MVGRPVTARSDVTDADTRDRRNSSRLQLAEANVQTHAITCTHSEYTTIRWSQKVRRNKSLERSTRSIAHTRWRRCYSRSRMRSELQTLKTNDDKYSEYTTIRWLRKVRRNNLSRGVNVQSHRHDDADVTHGRECVLNYRRSKRTTIKYAVRLRHRMIDPVTNRKELTKHSQWAIDVEAKRSSLSNVPTRTTTAKSDCWLRRHVVGVAM